MSAFDAEKIANFDPLAMTALTPEHIANFDPEAVAGFKPEQVIELPIDAIAGFAPEQMTALAPEAKLGIGDVVPEFDEFPLEVKLAIVPEEAMLLGGVGDFDALATVVSGPPLTDAELADLGFPVLEAEGAENDVDIALSADEIEYLETFAANNALAAMENLFDTSESVEKANAVSYTHLTLPTILLV